MIAFVKSSFVTPSFKKVAPVVVLVFVLASAIILSTVFSIESLFFSTAVFELFTSVCFDVIAVLTASAADLIFSAVEPFAL